MSEQRSRPPFFARITRAAAPIIILAWVALILISTFIAVDGSWRSMIPALEKVGREHSVSVMPEDAPSGLAMRQMGQVFQESDSDSSAMIVLEGQEPLGDDAHAYYSELVGQLRDDPAHIQHVQDLWSDRLTSSSVESPDRKATYVQLNLVGDQGTALGEESVNAVREIVNRNPPPAGIDVYVTGAAPLASDMQRAGDHSILRITAVTVVIIFAVLLFVYRSIVTVILLLITVFLELAAARGVVAFLGHNDAFVLSTFAVNMLVFLAIAAGTDYGIFFFGRYQEARQAGEDRESAYYTMYRSVTPVVLASGLTIAGAIFCLTFTRLPYFKTMGIPCAIGMLVAVAVAVTAGPAVVALGSGFGLLEPKRKLAVQRWRGIGTAVVRWPGPILAASLALALLGLLTLPGYQTSYNDREYIPGDIPANQGYNAAERHFSQARLMPDILMIESGHDMRNPADFLILNRIAKAVFRVPGISRVQGITRPEGTPIGNTSIPFMLSLQNANMGTVMKYQNDRMGDMLVQADDMSKMITLMQAQYALTLRLNELTHQMTLKTHEIKDVIDDLRDSMADFDDFLRPIRNYLYWEPHCINIPICWSFRSLFDSFDGIDRVNVKFEELLVNLDKLDVLLPQIAALLPENIEILKFMRTMILTMHSTMTGFYDQMDFSNKYLSTMGMAYDESNNDESFFMPPEVFENEDFKKAMGSFLSPDGRAARFIISHRGAPATPEGIARVDQVKTAAEEALKGTPLQGAQVFLAGAASTAKDWHDGSMGDLWLAGVAAICLVFIIMLLITRSFIAALVIVGTVVLSLGASFGVSVLVWQYILGIHLHWMVLAMSVIILLAVGSDYNLLLVSRMKEEVAAGINTGIIRAMGGTGKVVTTAGLVFAFTMASMVVSDLRIIGQIGTTIALGLMFDTLIVRSFMTPAIAAMLGRWFWWPLRIRQRPASALLEPLGTRPMVRTLLLGDDRRKNDDHDDDTPTTEFPRPSA
ncbi:Transport protein [Mycolicibacterium rhodesiae NBB3]|uniref:Transport protein n=1 Tax=Mycolicibacterium rhodesiae (strain NBB3) TaxID=710685 RepID=G8RIX5_MYCRN|nr:RND family transporter [Mycolicibacterium rhodesiae]AEV70963.1 Transport protein [Mycolicibacterium rhodesiae NBB3]